MLEPRRADIVSATEVAACELVPEIRLRVAPASASFEDFRAQAAGTEAVVPYWARA
jgi:hypothetical protein